MSESLRKLKEIPVVNKLMQELERSLGIKDKVRLLSFESKSFLTSQVLAEFVLDIAKQCQNVSAFEQKLVDYEADFPIELINQIYSTITKMLPECFRTAVDNKEKPAFEKDHFGHNKMLADEPERPLFNDMDQTKGVEESVFDESERNDKEFLSRKFPGLAIPN